MKFKDLMNHIFEPVGITLVCDDKENSDTCFKFAGIYDLNVIDGARMDVRREYGELNVIAIGTCYHVGASVRILLQAEN